MNEMPNFMRVETIAVSAGQERIAELAAGQLARGTAMKQLGAE